MTGWLIGLSLLVLLAIVLLLKAGVQLEYGQSAMIVCLRIGPWSMQVLPANKKREKKRTGKKKQDETQQQEQAKPKGGKLQLLRMYLPLILRTVKRLCGKIKVDKLDLVLTAGAEDPGDAALQYGNANAVLGSLWQPIVNTCHVVDGHAKVDIDFDAKAPTVYLFCRLSLRIGQILVLAITFLVQAISIWLRRTKDADMK